MTRYIVAPNLSHYFFIAEYKTAYPTAVVIGPEGLRGKVEWKLDQGVFLSFLCYNTVRHS